MTENIKIGDYSGKHVDQLFKSNAETTGQLRIAIIGIDES